MGKIKESTGECVHYWIIETPEGPTSIGRCKYCGMVKEFSNTWTDTFNEHQVVDKADTRKEAAEIAV